jgi:hypothetical protein
MGPTRDPQKKNPTADTLKKKTDLRLEPLLQNEDRDALKELENFLKHRINR